MYLGNLHAGKTDHNKAAFESYALEGRIEWIASDRLVNYVSPASFGQLPYPHRKILVAVIDANRSPEPSGER